MLLMLLWSCLRLRCVGTVNEIVQKVAQLSSNFGKNSTLIFNFKNIFA